MGLHFHAKICDFLTPEAWQGHPKKNATTYTLRWSRWWMIYVRNIYCILFEFLVQSYVCYMLESRLTDLCTISHQIFSFLKIVFPRYFATEKFKAHHIPCWKSDPQSDPSLPSTKETPDDAWIFFVLPRLEIPHEILGDKFSKKKKNNKAEDFFCLWKLLKIYFPLVFEGTTDK